jgi:hypothetical protein
MLGCGRSAVLGKNQSQFVGALNQAGAGNGGSFDGTLMCLNGGSLPVRVHSSKLTIHGHPLVLWLCHELAVK